MTVSDYLIKKLADYNIKHIFMIVGGGAMYLNDAVIKQNKVKYICNHHEQASTMAAECYSRITGNIGVVLVTSGAGDTNTMTGLLGAWWDSIPLMIISGNARIPLLTYKNPKLRQLGVQDTRIVDMVKPITKYAVCVYDPLEIDYHVEKAYYVAKSGRPGPVWLDIPLDVQAAQIDEEKLIRFTLPQSEKPDLLPIAKKTLQKIKSSKKPAIIVGSGIRLSGSYDLFHKVLKKLKIPVTTSLTSHDIMWEDHPFYGGRFGPYGDQRGNDLVNKADCILILGERLYLWQIGYDYENWGKQAYKIMVDIDKEELNKLTMRTQFKIHADVKDFLEALNKLL